MSTKNTQDVKNMFASIAGKYDLTNDVLSFGLHRYWERQSLQLLPDNQNFHCLDLATGTGALLPVLCNKFAKVTGADFCPEMLEIAKKNYADKYNNLTLEFADALNLSYTENSFDVITVAYGVRNFSNLTQGLKEIRRVLKPKGSLMILEFGQPGGFFRLPYKFFAKYMLPFIGKILTGDKVAYDYLHKTSSEFPCGKEFSEILSQHGFAVKKVKKMMFGVVFCYLVLRD